MRLPVAVVLITAAGLAAAPPKKAARVAVGKPAESARPVPSSGTPASAAVDPAQIAALVDRHVDAKLTAAKVPASPRCSDEEFVRRAYLDLTGVIPPADRVTAFLADRSAGKRAGLIDDLLADPGYGRHLTDIWQAKLTDRTSENRFVLRQPFLDWMTDRFNANAGWDAFVRDLVTAEGTVEDNPAVTYFLMNRSVDKLTDKAARHFLGVRLECAQCHNHPFADWTQDQYWQTAAFFSKVRPERPRNTNLKKDFDPAKLGVAEGLIRSRAKDFFPESAKHLPPKPLTGPAPVLSPREPYRPALAAWLTAADNPFFAKAAVNRTWAQLFGAGLVDPVDDMLPDNEPSHPELLAELSRRFAAGGFDLKALYRGLARSNAYQRSARPPAAGGKSGPRLWAHMAVKVMTPEQLFDSLARVTGAADTPAAKAIDAAVKKGVPPQGRGYGLRDRFVDFYLAGAGEFDPAEYDAGIPQALRLMNSRLTDPTAAARRLLPAGRRGRAGPAEVAEAVDTVYLTALARRPSPAERSRLVAHIARSNSPSDGLSDVMWAVLNSSEFALIR